jgi:acetyl esterase/lipase
MSPSSRRTSSGRPRGEPLLARIYRPAGASGPLPALVDLHGGAWNFFDRTVDFHIDRGLAARGIAP